MDHNGDNNNSAAVATAVIFTMLYSTVAMSAIGRVHNNDNNFAFGHCFDVPNVVNHCHEN